MRVRADSAEYRTAVHEAGHAVAAVALGRKIRFVTIIAERGCLGRVQTSQVRSLRAGAPRTLRHIIEREVVILLAGRAAERLAGFGSHGGRQDWAWSRELLSFLTETLEEQDAYLRWLLARAHTLVRTHRRATHSLARKLLIEREMRGAHVVQFLAAVDPPLVARCHPRRRPVRGTAGRNR